MTLPFVVVGNVRLEERGSGLGCSKALEVS